MMIDRIRDVPTKEAPLARGPDISDVPSKVLTQARRFASSM
jgi:hypothetical protein